MATLTLTFPFGTNPTAVALTGLYGSPAATAALPLAFSGPAVLPDGRQQWAATFAGAAPSYSYAATATVDGRVRAVGDVTVNTVAGDGPQSTVPPSVPFDFSGRPGLTLYATIANDRQQTYVAGGLQPTAGTSRPAAAVPMPEVVPGCGVYVGQLPGTLPAGLYFLPIWRQAGATPASTDPLYGAAGPWGGTASGGTSPAGGNCAGGPGFGGTTLVLDWSGSAVNSLAPLRDSVGAPGRPVALPAAQSSVTTAQQVLASLYQARASGQVGINSITIDGQQVSYEGPAQLDAAILFWERKVALLSGRRRRAFTIRLDGF